MSLKDDARREIARVNDNLEQGKATSKVVSTVIDQVAPGLGTVLDALHSKCPPLEVYKSELQEVVDGKRDSMPEKPDLRKYYMPRLLDTGITLRGEIGRPNLQRHAPGSGNPIRHVHARSSHRQHAI